MRTYDFSPLYRASVGFDRLADFFNDVSQTNASSTYPPFNVEAISEGSYRISMAVAGFSESELEILVERDTLKISGQHAETESENNFLHRGIASRDFQHTFRLAEHVKVDGAQLENGMLTIDLSMEIPESMKPRKVQIESFSEKKLLKDEAA